MRPAKSSKIDKDTNEIIATNYENLGPQENPEEERYCVCNRVSFGEMIGCDNDYVKIILIIFSVIEANGSILIALILKRDQKEVGFVVKNVKILPKRKRNESV